MPNDSVFMPVQAQDLEGPFSGFLKPQPQGQAQARPGPVNVAGGVAMAANAFLQSATQSRVKAFEQRENEKLAGVNRLNTYMTQVYPGLTPDKQKEALAIFNRAMGGNVLTAMDDIPSKGGKGTQGLSSKTKEKAGDPAQAHHHFTSILKDLALGMVGGQMPKGAPEFNANEVIGQLALIAGDPKNTIAGVVGEHTSALEALAKGFAPGTTREEAALKFAPHFSAIAQIAPDKARSLQEIHLGPYQSAPQIGSKEWERQELQRSFSTPPEPVGQSPQAAAAPARADRAGQAFPESAAAAPPVSQQYGAPTGRTLTSEQVGYLKDGGKIRAGEDWIVQGAGGSRVRGRIIDTPNGTGFYDMNNRQLNVDLNDLIPFEGRRPINIVNPKDQNDARSVLLDNATGMKMDQNGIPLPADMQSWQEGAGFYRPNQDQKVFINAQGHQVYKRTDGTYYVSPDAVGTARLPPDHTDERDKAGQAKEARAALKQVEMQHGRDVTRIKGQWAARTASIEKDFPGLNEAAKKAKVAEFKAAQTQQLKELDEDYNVQRRGLAIVDAPPEKVDDKKPAPQGTSLTPNAKKFLP